MKFSQGPNANQGGFLGVKEKGDLLPEIEEKVFSLETGQVSDIISTEFGYHVFKIEKKITNFIKPLKEVEDQIKNLIFKNKAEEKFQEYINELYDKAYISIKE